MIRPSVAPSYPPITRADVAPYLDFINPYVIEAHDVLSVRPGSQRNVSIYRHLEAALSRDGDWPDKVAAGDFDELNRFGEQLAGDITSARDFTLSQAFGAHAVVSAMALINQTRLGKEELPTAVNMTTYFLTQFAGHLTLKLPDAAFEETPHIGLLGERLGKQSLLIAQKCELNPTWLKTKFAVLGERLLLRQHLEEVIELEPQIEVDNGARLHHNNDSLFNELQRVGMYIIRPEVYQGSHSNWDISDTLAIRHMQLSKGHGPYTVCSADWPGVFISAHEVSADTTENGQPQLTQDIKAIDLTGIGLIAHMDKTGGLYADLYSAMPLAELYKKAGKPTNYEVLRQFIMERYFDQSMPDGVVQEVQEATKRLVDSADPGHDRESGKVYSDLLSLRIQRLQAV